MRPEWMKTTLRSAALGISAAALSMVSTPSQATETEHTSFKLFRAPGPVTIDGKFDDWDLSGSMLICSDVENYRDQFASWQSAMFDDDNLYLLSRWIDTTPLNNPGIFGSDMGFAGDCLQVRIIVDADGNADGNGEQATERCTHLDAWRGRDGRDGVSCGYGRGFNGGPEKLDGVKNMLELGAKQAFVVNEDNSGYTQEIAIPWKFLAPAGYTPKAGDAIIMTYEPNFGTSSKLRISTKDLFRPGVTPDRVFAFMASHLWAPVKLMDAPDGKLMDVRLSDGRTFPAKIGENGDVEVDWTGLYVENKLEGFKAINVTMPEDGFVSLIIRDANGFVVRNLLNAEFFTKGDHEILWDGLATQNGKTFGNPVDVGDYTWEAIYRKALDLKLVGWAANAGIAPYDCPHGNWGGDQGNPNTVDCDASRVYLGWTGSEAGQALVCVNYDGIVQWRHKRGGFGGASIVAVHDGVVYVYDLGQDNTLYRLNAERGEYVNFEGKDEATLGLSPILAPYTPAGARDAHTPVASGMAVADGKIFLSYGPVNSGWRQPQASGDVVIVLDAATGAKVGDIKVSNPTSLSVGADGKLYLLADGAVFSVDTAALSVSEVLPAATVGAGARSVAADANGAIFVAYDAPVNQIKVFEAGKFVRAIGREGGRAPVGPWEKDGFLALAGIKIDAQGRLWVSEADDKPRRFTLWNAADGSLLREFFGPTHYGAGGGAVCPTDPLSMVGLNCEWKLDAETGRAECVAVISRDRWANARFGQSPDGRVYLAVGGGWPHATDISIFERVGEADWKLRTRITAIPDEDRFRHDGLVDAGHVAGVRVWADANGDQVEQDNEVKQRLIPDFGGWIDGWYMPMNQCLTFGGGNYVVAVTGWTACGAPEYDVDQFQRLPDNAIYDGQYRGGMGAQKNIVSEDGKYVIYNAHYGAESSDIPCYEIATGRKVAAYPSNYVGVHGGHSAPPAKQGLIRAAYDYAGAIKMPEPLNNVFFIGTDKGEWHLVNDAGYYVGKLFEGDAMKIRWPDEAVPGANMNTVPPGMGAEDFGGSVTRATDGRVFVQAGKTAFINMELTGLDTYKVLGSGALSITEDDQTQANMFKVKYLSVAESPKVATVARKDVIFSGNPDNDFGPAFADFGPDTARIRSWIACGAERLYLAWRVSDSTPWINGATSFKNMYAMGDTVDFQLGTDTDADKKRGDAVAGDMRISIGSHNGANVAAIYRKVSDEKAPETFHSGVWRDGYTMDLVKVLDDAAVSVSTYDGGYVVEASLPLATLGFTPAEGLRLKGDVGVTFGDPAGKDTVLRVYWANQATGIVADEVAELMMNPALWGTFEF